MGAKIANIIKEINFRIPTLIVVILVLIFVPYLLTHADTSVILKINKEQEITINKGDCKNFTLNTQTTTTNTAGYTLAAFLRNHPTTDITIKKVAPDTTETPITNTPTNIIVTDKPTVRESVITTYSACVVSGIADGEYNIDLAYTLAENHIEPVPTPPDPAKATAIVPNFASTATPNSDIVGSGPQFSLVGADFGATPTVKIGDKDCTNVSVNSNGTALTCTGPTGMTDGEKEVTVNGNKMEDKYAVYYSSFNFPILQEVDPTAQNCQGTPETPVIYRDARDSQLYFVAKMQDGKCWMLDNLKYKPNGDATGTQTAGYSANQVWSGSLYHDPKYIDPITVVYCYGNTNISPENITKCGFLYNTRVATAGTDDGVAFVDASGSICPTNWVLPRGGYLNNPANDFAALNGYMNGDGGPSTTEDATHAANWGHLGSFRGVFSGYWDSSSRDQGGVGYFWSSYVHDYNPNYADSANILEFSGGVVYPGTTSYYSDSGRGVRCVAG